MTFEELIVEMRRLTYEITKQSQSRAQNLGE